jgi:hypothetical protein
MSAGETESVKWQEAAMGCTHISLYSNGFSGIQQIQALLLETFWTFLPSLKDFQSAVG